MKYTISSFSGGLNTLVDSRSLQPNQEGEPAESPDMENFEITAKGALVTSTGFELVSSGGTPGAGGIKNLMTYEKDATTKELMFVQDRDIFYITASSPVWQSIGDYGTPPSNAGSVVYKGTSSTRRAIFGTDSTANFNYTWDGTIFAPMFAPKSTFTVTIASPAVFTKVGHGLSVGDGVYFTTTGALPTGLLTNQLYYVIAAGLTADNFEVSFSLGGSAINTSGGQSGVHSLFVSTGVPTGWIMETFQGYLFVASGSSLYYSAIEDQTNWAGGGVVSFPDIITGVKAEGEFMQVHTSRESFTIQMYYNDAFSLSAPLKKPFKNASGCLAHKTLVSVYNDSYHLSRDGVQKFGADPNYIAGQIRTNSLSWKINPSLFQSKLAMNYISSACAAFFNKKVMFSIPYGSDSYNSRIFQYNWDYDAWTVRTGVYAAGLAVFPDSNNRDELYFASALAPELYKFNNNWSYAGAGYTKSWKSKVFTFGSSLIQKQFNYIDLAGAMLTSTVFYVDVTVDGVTTTFQIDSNNLLQSSSGGFYGDDYLGSIYYGGDVESPFKRYGARLPIPFALTQGREIQLTIRNQAAGQPFSVDFLQFDLDPLDNLQIPSAAQITQTV